MRSNVSRRWKSRPGKTGLTLATLTVTQTELLHLSSPITPPPVIFLTAGLLCKTVRSMMITTFIQNSNP